ncbi:hypothetical protein TPHA_0B04790 [Tetrapisispora phaffii CBS 4417]|uniref:Ras-associating domain-containing protein n=1 Tax=Tetrapisispora phaffii (strain ATCC 24235 / CBS 4417 / NBRC 1672 / NRRL Y-8282 / UCD 70-5) TaxID=1071381 RepID=G8BQ67_TETPH|nr:hypothetical protein TPHA_0B04790 [Tetrapisispora phaffii CBS 4417]CCE62148.1 hypothetical protein TPHA_0B04790 [Tetrapisispora phaffii CBS 4417]
MSVEDKGSDNNGMVIDVNCSKWSAEDVASWCVSTLDIDNESELYNNLIEQEISGDLLKELSLQDCKDLCGSANLKLAIKFKLQLNKLLRKENDEYHKTQNETLVFSLDNLYSTLSVKLRDFQSQYVRLRMDVLDVVKSSSNSNSPGNSDAGMIGDLYRSRSQNQSNGTLSNPQHPHINDDNTKKDHSEQLNGKNPIHAVSRQNSTLSKVAAKAPSSSNGLNQESTGPSSNSEPLKQLRASKEDSCEKILRNAMKRHHLNEEDWRQYVLVICYGDQEKALELDDSPVVTFKNLKMQGLKPTIMLRHRGDFEEFNVGAEGKTAITPGGRL